MPPSAETEGSAGRVRVVDTTGRITTSEQFYVNRENPSAITPQLHSIDSQGEGGLDDQINQEAEATPEAILSEIGNLRIVQNDFIAPEPAHSHHTRNRQLEKYSMLIDPPEPDCPICREPYDNKENHVAIRIEGGCCDHVFAKECLQAWIDIGATTCPSCRVDITSALSGGMGSDDNLPEFLRLLRMYRPQITTLEESREQYSRVSSSFADDALGEWLRRLDREMTGG